MSLLTFFKLLGGLVALVGGGDLLVRGSSKIAASLGVSSLVIGLTIVAFGTSAPELVVSSQSIMAGHGNMAMANVIGSNIFNILLILGACAVFAPLIVSSQLVRIDVPLMAASAILVLIFSFNGNISNLEGTVLVLILLFYTVFLIKKSRKESREVQEEFNQEYGEKNLTKYSFLVNLLFLLVGMGLLVLGGDWFVAGAIDIAKYLGVSETVIGLTIVAGGTSLPEVVTSIIATIKGERDIAIGNVIGSNIFNILLIVGVCSIFSPGGLTVADNLLAFDLPIMIATCIACLPIFLAGMRITRIDGFIFLTCYLVYLMFIILQTTQHEWFMDYQRVVIYFILPVILLSLVGSIIKAARTVREREFLKDS